MHSSYIIGVRQLAPDVLRGLAIALMVLDHVVALYDPASLLRLPTRLAMPLFMVLAGFYLSPRFSARHVLVFVAAAVSVPPIWILSLSDVPILVVFCVVYLPVQLFRPFPCLGMALAACAWLLIPSPWWGYHPAAVAFWLFLGLWVRSGRPLLFGSRGETVQIARFNPVGLLAYAGRYPLSIYLIHLYILAGLWFYL